MPLATSTRLACRHSSIRNESVSGGTFQRIRLSGDYTSAFRQPCLGFGTAPGVSLHVKLCQRNVLTRDAWIPFQNFFERCSLSAHLCDELHRNPRPPDHGCSSHDFGVFDDHRVSFLVAAHGALEIRSGPAYFDNDRFGFFQLRNTRLSKHSTIDAPAICKGEPTDAKLLQFQAEQSLAGDNPLHDAARLIFYSLGMPSARKLLISLRAVVEYFKM